MNNDIGQFRFGEERKTFKNLAWSRPPGQRQPFSIGVFQYFSHFLLSFRWRWGNPSHNKKKFDNLKTGLLVDRQIMSMEHGQTWSQSSRIRHRK